jgi:hypothetical protein
MGKKLKKKTKKKKIEKNADVEYYTTYPKTPEKRAVNPNFQLCISAPEGTPSGSRHFQ